MFSTEHLEGRGFFLEKSGRFSHSRGYVEELCEKFDYRLSYFSLNALRKDKDDVIMAGLYLLEF